MYKMIKTCGNYRIWPFYLQELSLLLIKNNLVLRCSDYMAVSELIRSIKKRKLLLNIMGDVF